MKRTRLGRLISEARRARGLSFRGMGESLGVNHTHVFRLERGENHTSVSQAAAWAHDLGEPMTRWVEAVLQDELDAAGIKMSVKVR